MEFSILKHLKRLDEKPVNPLDPNELGTSLFMSGNMGARISEKLNGYAKAAGMSRRGFVASSLGFSAAMLAAPSARTPNRRAW